MRHAPRFAALLAVVYVAVLGVAGCNAETRLRPGLGVGGSQSTPNGTTTSRAFVDLGEYEVKGAASDPVTGACPGGTCGVPHSLPTLRVDAPLPTGLYVALGLIVAMIGVGIYLVWKREKAPASKPAAGFARWPVLVACAGLSLVALGLVGCDKDQGTAAFDTGATVAKDAGAATGNPLLVIAGGLLAAVPGLLGWRKASTAAAYTESEWTPDHLSEFVAGVRANPAMAVALKRVLDEAK